MIGMDQDLSTLQTVHGWLQAGHPVLLVTVARTWGSSPRPPGALMALRADGRVVGSVSGGCVEDDMIRRVQQSGLSEHVEVIRYGEDQEQARCFGIPCGGTLELVQELLFRPDALSGLLDRLMQGERVIRELDLHSGAVVLRPAESGQLIHLDEAKFSSTFGPSYRLLLIGAGQLSVLLANISMSLGFAVTVCDPREAYFAEWAVDEVPCVRTMPDDTVVAMKPDERTAVVALTHDPKLDDLALMEALVSPAFYVAALGSQLNNDRRRERLREFELSDQQIAALKGPAGVFIGSKTPAEIAVSIAAELVAAKNGVLETTRMVYS